MISKSDEELAFGSIVKLRAALIARAISPLELIDTVLARIEREEPKLTAWVAIDADGARAAARELRVDESAPPLAGIPFGVKDVIDVCGLPTRFGADIASPPAAFDAWCVAAVRRAGAIPLGKLQTTPFAFSDPAPTRNPWNTTRSPGGSSAGSGAAVGARQIPFAFGTQTGGSTLRPAAFNGVVGFKPSFGAIPTPGVSILAPSFDTVGIIARDTEDATTIFAIYDPRVLDARPPHGARILSALAYREDLSGSQVRGAIENALGKLAGAGAECVRCALPSVIDEVESLWRTIAAYEASGALAPVLRGRSIGPHLDGLLAEGLKLGVETYRAARARREEIRAALDAVLSGCDALALPTAGQVPDPQTTGSALFLRPWTFNGNPSISIPVGFDSDGMPIGMQLVAKRGDDARLLALARWAEATIALDNPGPRK